MFVAVYGHGFRPDPAAANDAFSLFRTRALAMGWEYSGGSAKPAAPGLWAMNDAGWTHARDPGDTSAPLAAWFHVDAGAVDRMRSLPVQPFMRCAADAIAGAGTIDLQLVQLLLPLQRLDPAGRGAKAPLPSMESMYWFSDAKPVQWTSISVGLHAAGDPSIAALSGQIADRLDGLDQDVFRIQSWVTAGPAPIPAPLFGDDFWAGKPADGLTVRGELAVWSFDAIGWLCAVVADALHSIGIHSELIVTVEAATP